MSSAQLCSLYYIVLYLDVLHNISWPVHYHFWFGLQCACEVLVWAAALGVSQLPKDTQCITCTAITQKLSCPALANTLEAVLVLAVQM